MHRWVYSPYTIRCILELFTLLPRETVWKIRMGFTLGSYEALKRGEKPLIAAFAPPKQAI
jgi:hypothetical protein